MRNTKIVATLGPATDDYDRIRELVDAGIDVARMNLSHGTLDEHRARMAMVRRASAEAGRPVALLLDLQGPKIRTGALQDGKPVSLEVGQSFVITTDPVAGTSRRVSTTYDGLPRDVRPGNRLLLSDGQITLEVKSATDTEIHTIVRTGGELKERQGVNLPGVRLSLKGLTEKDHRDLAFGLAQDVDYVAISFVRDAKNVRNVKALIEQAGKDTPVIAKLEKPEAIDVLPAILDAADGVMVARGDLGVEVGPEKVPLLQKQIIAAANQKAKPVITATQMLESMIHSPQPTRAEASDVANAILDGTDAVMLSGETAIGDYPAEAVKTMARVARAVEGGGHVPEERRWWNSRQISSPPEAISSAVAEIVRALPDVQAIWVLTQSGTTARLVSHHRPHRPIIAFTPEERVWRRMALLAGVVPIKTPPAANFQELEKVVFPIALQRGLARVGDTVVITGSHPFNEAAPTNFLKIHVIQ